LRESQFLQLQPLTTVYAIVEQSLRLLIAEQAYVKY